MRLYFHDLRKLEDLREIKSVNFPMSKVVSTGPRGAGSVSQLVRKTIKCCSNAADVSCPSYHILYMQISLFKKSEKCLDVADKHTDGVWK